jgi:phosphatidyl-myo-inositol alpha-mannosyltransferase
MTAGLRVGLVCPYSFGTHGGVQNQVLGFARYLGAQGHQPYVLAPGELPADSAAGLASVSSAGTAIPVPYNGSVARVNFGPVTATRVRRWLRTSDLDLLHVHEPITPSISLLALWAADVPVVATFHTATPGSRSMRLAGDTLHRTISKIDAGIAVSESARKVVRRYLDRDPVLISNGFSWAEFAAWPGSGSQHPASRWRGGEHPRLTFLGRGSEPRKGLSVLLEALPAIRADYNLDVVIAGETNRTRIRGCRVLGSIDDRARARLLADSDVFVAPQIGRESFGLVLLEAMASGTPVVASDIPAFTDLLRPDGTVQSLGELFPRGEPAALAAAVVRVLSEPDPGRTERARAAARRYDWSRVGPAILDVYEAALTGQQVPVEAVR